METKPMVSIHNKFDIVVRNAITREVEEEFKGENIVLDRIYTRLLNFQTYFDHIVFGGGSGTPTVGRTTLFTRIGSKPAVNEQVVRAYPTSIWTRKITLGTEEFNGSIITEVGISNETTNINTHAMISDAEGNPLSVEKNNLRIIDIYATVYIEMYDVDSGLFWYDNGLRDYLTGTGSAGNTLGISNLKEAGIATINGIRTIDTANKTVKVAERFNVGLLNKDIKFMYWTGIGLACEIPRPGVFEGSQINDLPIGTGDGVNKKFNIGRTPNTPIESLAIKVNGVVAGFTYHITNEVILDISPISGAIVTASYKSIYYPKTANNVFDMSMKIGFGLGQPSPVVPPPIQGIVPGATTPIAGDTTYGFYGEVFPDDLINGEYLAKQIGLTAGAIQYTDVPWLKFALDGKILFVAKKTFRNNLSWDNINAVNAVYGDKTIDVNGLSYKVRLMKTGLVDPMASSSGVACHGSEWNKLMLPIHEQAKDKSWAYPANVESDIPYWEIDYTDNDLQTISSAGNGSYTWCQETQSSSYRLFRGYTGVSYSVTYASSYATADFGWRPVLELIV